MGVRDTSTVTVHVRRLRESSSWIRRIRRLCNGGRSGYQLAEESE